MIFLPSDVMRAVLLLLLIAMLALPTAAQTITDGDTLELNGTTHRLHGVDAPETKQECPDG